MTIVSIEYFVALEFASSWQDEVQYSECSMPAGGWMGWGLTWAGWSVGLGALLQLERCAKEHPGCSTGAKQPLAQSSVRVCVSAHVLRVSHSASSPPKRAQQYHTKGDSSFTFDYLQLYCPLFAVPGPFNYPPKWISSQVPAKSPYFGCPSIPPLQWLRTIILAVKALLGERAKAAIIRTLARRIFWVTVSREMIPFKWGYSAVVSVKEQIALLTTWLTCLHFFAAPFTAQTFDIPPVSTNGMKNIEHYIEKSILEGKQWYRCKWQNCVYTTIRSDSIVRHMRKRKFKLVPI